MTITTPWSPVGYLVYKRCVDKDTPVLTQALTWVPAGSLKEGDKLLGFDEAIEKHSRYLKPSVVEHIEIEEAHCLGIRLSNEDVLYATPDHEWLVKMANTQLEWRETKDLLKSKKNGPVYLPKVFGDIWATKTDYRSGYLAAAFDGEGCLDKTNSVCFTQVNNGMMQRVEQYLQELSISYKKTLKNAKTVTLYKNPRQDCFDLKIHKIKAIMQLLGSNDCTRLKTKLIQNLEKRPQRMRCAPEDFHQVVEVFDAGIRQVAVLQTSTKTHFTGGYPSHNTYARPKPNTVDETEEWGETVDRVIRSCRDQLDCGFTPDEEQRLREYHLRLKGTVSGRKLWQCGTETVDRLGLASMQNCWFTTVNTYKSFTWAFDLLMLGGGVGYNIQREHVYKLPKVRANFSAPNRQDTQDADFIVPDTRSGWVRLLDYTLRKAFTKDSSFNTYSTIAIRGKGAPIKGFGGTASGPEDLCIGIGNISSILEGRRGKQLRPIDCLDIMNIIGAIVVSGNVRRSAQIAIGDADDLQFLNAKRWDLGGIPNWRAMSNNSVVCNDIALLPEAFWNGYMGNGEPYGLINLKLARTCGRSGDTERKDKKVNGVNPCGEITLEDWEPCCLSEIFLPNIETKEELEDVTKLLYRVNKHSLRLPCHHPETEKVVRRNARMGIGVTGYLQATEEQRSWLKENYDKLSAFDETYSKDRGFARSIKLTTIKPSGTLSLLAGVTPGCHPAFAQFMIRRIRVSSNSPLLDVIINNGYRTEYQIGYDGTPDRSTIVAEFPFCYPDGTKLAKDMSAVDQLEVVKRLQTEWSDNAVSCTVYYSLEELPAIKEYLKENYNKFHKSLSFLLRSEHGFNQAPLEEITKDEYKRLVSMVEPITSVNHNVNFTSDDECAAGSCPIR